ncbi:MAG: FAD-binding protein, partial [Kiritimatiellae bacterium]|nr:FAD-binding protein [Kiritimatiellia bacterium]
GDCAAVAGAPAGAERGEESVLVAEADESDGTLAEYSPFVTVVTNVDLDHADRFPDVESFERVFSGAFGKTSGAIIYCADHPRAAALAEKAHTKARKTSFGFSPDADWRLENWRAGPDCTTGFDLLPPVGAAGSARERIAVSLKVPGRHNALNAAAAIAAAAIAGVEPQVAAAILGESAALPDRRFERVGRPDGFTVVSDYSHHPVEIKALVETALSMKPRRLLAVFQPHRYTRTKTFLADFPPAFAGVDKLVLCPVYAASEPPLPGGSSADLYAAFRRGGGVDAPILAPSKEAARDFLASEIRRGDLVLVIGAGDIVSICPALCSVRPGESDDPSPGISAFGTLAPVPHLKEVSSEEEIRGVCAEARERNLHIAVVGAGTNTFVVPTGFRGLALKLSRQAFSYISPLADTSGRENGDRAMLEVGAATPGTVLLAYCKAFGLSGLECMAGIPGLAGGWLAMNAGVKAGSFCDVVESASCIRLPDGKTVRLSRADLGAGYRACPGLAEHVALSIRIALRKTTPGEVAAAIDGFKKARTNLSGLRTCGSVFKNPAPPAPPAGALADAAGCKSMSVGDARVTDFHANIIAAGPSATASDVAALVELVRDRVLNRSGIALEREIRFLG